MPGSDPRVESATVPATQDLPAPHAVTFGTAFRRGLVRHCPHCGSGHLFRRYFSMVERCPRCGLRLERVEGHWTGALGINTIVVFGAMLLTLFIGVFATWPEPQMLPIIVVGVLIALAGPFVFFPFSKTIWLAIDIAIRPVQPDELRAEPGDASASLSVTGA